MNYQTIENKIRSYYGGSSELDNWVMDCGNHIVTKIVAFNFFSDIHLGTLNDNDLLKSMFNIENHLRTTDKNIDPLDRIKGVIKPFDPVFWNSPKTQIKSSNKFSTIKTVRNIRRSYNSFFQGENGNRTIGTLEIFNEEEIDKLLSEFKKELENGTSVPFKFGNSIIWFANSNELDTLNKVIPVADEVRNLLGLYIYNEYLIEVRFVHDENKEPHKPTIFHSEFGSHWKPSYRNDGWGITLNLDNFTDGVRESVLKGGDWPKSSFNKLGTCASGIRKVGWDTYYQKRVDEFRSWADKKIAIINDLEYFLSKNQIGYGRKNVLI
ncbi:MAG: hypothetical protein A2W99_06655 [Bacteroidetes bacterium GWF2_33_16]|nr:MAG: hypothetical protein A2X00_12090 [Bacteroidetes bacterium GWE2_32_14]OFY04376.1 MAG: hypothetical protein A2W99_06655 [Bacteroidetes bacterium GWF2_33_16]